MQKVVEINVSVTDIKKGMQKSASSCAISLALLRKYKDANWVQVFGGCNILVDNKDIKVMASDTFKVQNFINTFDIKKTDARPFSFKLLQQVKE